MSRTGTRYPVSCAKCFRAQYNHGLLRRPFSRSSRLPITTSDKSYHDKPTQSHSIDENDARSTQQEDGEPGAMTSRLRDLSESDLTGTRAEDIEAAGFSQELKEQLLGRISASKSARRSNQQAFSVSELSSVAGKQDRDAAAATPWSGTESMADANLRMLNDASKPIRVPSRPGTGPRVPKRVDTGRPSPKAASPVAQGTRLASARDRSSTYAYLKDPSLSPEEREKIRKQLKERFGGASRTMPATLQGLASLANERIEDAIARGQFANLPSRGKKLERDADASNPFIDTTEYLMNKMIQKQDIVPPWIEKQQELVSAATRFRARLRNDWRRHAARMIAAGGGPLEDQLARADAYAAAEMAVNPPRVKKEVVNAIGSDGQLRQVSLHGEPRVPAGGGAPTVETSVSIEPAPELEPATDAAQDPNTHHSAAHSASTPPPQGAASGPTARASDSTSTPDAEPATPTPPPPQPRPVGPPFRDQAWESTEASYHAAAIADLNALTRSYNLMAPNAAKKPYFALARELRSAYADVAPSVAGAIAERALGPRARVDEIRGREGSGLVAALTGAGGHVARVRDEGVEKQYGFRQLLRDVFGREGRA